MATMGLTSKGVPNHLGGTRQSQGPELARMPEGTQG